MKARKVIIVALMLVMASILSGCNETETSSLDVDPTKITVTKAKTVERTGEVISNATIVDHGLKVEKSSSNIKDLPESIMQQVAYWQSVYPNMDIGVGLYSLDGKNGYEYNANEKINSACTIKAAFSKYVLQTCEKNGIDIWSTSITFEERHDDFGSGAIILYGEHGIDYSIGYLVQLLLGESDNVAYNMLLDMFPLSGFYQMLSEIGGQDDGRQWGAASVTQRKNEWLDVYKYISTGTDYANILKDDLTNTKYAYIPEGMSNWHNYMHKSGWCDEDYEYPAAGDCAIIDEKYLLIILTQDYTTGSGHIDAIHSISDEVETYYYSNNGYIF